MHRNAWGLMPFRVQPELNERVWGGVRLGPRRTLPIGESWLAGPGIRVSDGPHAGSTLDDLAMALGPDLVGTRAPGQGRFPLLIKLLDPADWLSVQVHPDDDTARRLEGPHAVGKTEAWYIVEADAGASILLGARPDVPANAIRDAIRTGGLTALLQRRTVAAGQTYLVPSGTLHAVGPGALIYEIQQPSDLTYRVDDWGRPATQARPLHTEQALASVAPERRPFPVPAAEPASPSGVLVACAHFVLEHRDPTSAVPLDGDPAGTSVHVLTVVTGTAVIEGNGWREPLGRFEIARDPGQCGRVPHGGRGDAATRRRLRARREGAARSTPRRRLRLNSRPGSNVGAGPALAVADGIVGMTRAAGWAAFGDQFTT